MARAEIINLTRNVVLHEAPSVATSLAARAKGFLFTRPGNRAIVFLFLPARTVSFHMWFVFGPIDLVAIDTAGAVVDIVAPFLPWRRWRAKTRVAAVLELPAGTVARTGTRVGDQIALPPMRHVRG